MNRNHPGLFPIQSVSRSVRFSIRANLSRVRGYIEINIMLAMMLIAISHKAYKTLIRLESFCQSSMSISIKRRLLAKLAMPYSKIPPEFVAHFELLEQSSRFPAAI